ncbi:hypothetical protein L4X63_21860 [Geomonas sp. Red32]|nr:hypothetical protein [Geomonas sp. Red32]
MCFRHCQLRRSAEKARKAALEHLVASMRDGAFAPFTQNAVVQALLVPLGGIGVYALDILAKLKI